MGSQQSIFISHAWGGISDEILGHIVNRLEAEQIPFILDKRDLTYRGSIREFMVRLGKADMVIIILSNKYLRSEYCMFELIQIYKSENLQERIFPVVLDEVKISSSVDRLEFVKYWENQLIELQNKVKELHSLSFIEGITDDLNLYTEIRNNIARLTGILRDINTLNIQLHRESDYNDLIEAIKRRIKPSEPAVTTLAPPKETIKAAPEKIIPGPAADVVLQAAKSEKPFLYPRLLRNVAIVGLALFGAFMAWGILSKSDISAKGKDSRSGIAFPQDSNATVNSTPSTTLNGIDSATSPVTVVQDNVRTQRPGMTNAKPTYSEEQSKQGLSGGVTNTPTANQKSKHVVDTTGVSTKPVVPKTIPEDGPAKKEEPKLNLTKSMVLPKGTPISARNIKTFSSDDPNSLPRRVTFQLDKPIVNGQYVVVPAGSSIVASVIKVRKSEYRRTGTMDLIFEYLEAPGGQKISLGGNELHLEAKGTIPYEIPVNTKLQIKTTAPVTIKY